MKNHDFFLIRHIVFIMGELKASFKDSRWNWYNFYTRIKVRLLSNYFQSLVYYLNPKKNEKTNDHFPKLKTHGYQILENINVNEIDFVTYTVDKLLNDKTKVVSTNQVDFEKAEKFAKEKGFHKIARNYFNSDYCNFLVYSWNTKTFKDDNRLGTARWHRDRDGYKVLKFFIYLNDVDLDTGPHQFAVYSHVIRPLRFVPQIRYFKKNVEKYFPDINTFVGKKGTCFVEDTTGLHKGSPPKKGYRKLLQFSYFNGDINWYRHIKKINLN